MAYFKSKLNITYLRFGGKFLAGGNFFWRATRIPQGAPAPQCALTATPSYLSNYSRSALSLKSAQKTRKQPGPNRPPAKTLENDSLGYVRFEELEVIFRRKLHKVLRFGIQFLATSSCSASYARSSGRFPKLPRGDSCDKYIICYAALRGVS